MPTLPTKLRAPFWLFASALPLVLTAGCPQLASDEFTKANFDSGGSGGTTPSIDISNAGGSGTTATTSQGGTDANPDAGTGATDGDADAADTDSDSDTDTDTDSTSSDAVTTDSGTTESATTDSGTTEDTTFSGTTDGGTTGDILPPECEEEEEICDGLDNDCDEAIDEDDVCAGSYACDGIPLDADQGYMFCARPASGDIAATQCENYGMVLVQIDSEEENEALVAEADVQFSGDGGSGGNTGGGNWTSGTTRGGQGDQLPVFWTGGSDQAEQGHWIWLGSGTPFWEGDASGAPVDDAYTNWGAGRPNGANDDGENCAAVYFQENSDEADIGTWNDLSCEDGYPFICEAP